MRFREALADLDGLVMPAPHDLDGLKQLLTREYVIQSRLAEMR
jgi:hypothetical protein